MNKKQTGKLFLLSAPSGCGKTTVTYKLLETLQPTYDITRVVTYTSRAPRLTDKPEIDYHFLSVDEFERRIEQNFFLEWSKVYEDYHGTPGDMLEKIEMGSSYIAVVDRLGVNSILKKYQKAVTLWLEPPSLDILERRLRDRKSEQEEQICKRLTLAQQEIKEAHSFPYDYHVINDLFDATVNELKTIIQNELDKKLIK